MAAVVVAVAAGWVLVLPSRPAAQPLAFNHAKHQALTCAGCHVGAESAEHATLPGADLCAKCHASAPKGVDAGTWSGLQRGLTGWVRVTRVPEHAMFSHRRHVALGRLDCSSCHGDVGRRTDPIGRVPMRLDMKTCRACHEQEGASEDCAACHR